MLALFKDVKPYVKPKSKVAVPRPDNLIFRLHYRLTFSILLVCAILVSSYAYIDSSGSAIQCLLDKGSPVPQDVINRYCWIMGTFTLPKYFEGEQGEEFLYHGVGAQKDDDEKVYHAYYQWVPLFLTFQAFLFYAPHWIWKQLEGGRMKHIIAGLNDSMSGKAAERDKEIDQLAAYMRERIEQTHEHRGWARKFFFCECLNLLNVIVQIFLTNVFLGYEFTKYGTQVINFPYMDPEDRVDPMSRIFPRMTKCTFHKFGGSGTIQRFDSLCVLGMNILNEKIYIFLWFWFIILAVATAVALIVRICQFASPNMRDRFVKLDSQGYLDTSVDRKDVEDVVRKLSYSDWLILYYLAQSMDKANFGRLLKKLKDNPPEYEDSMTYSRDSPDGTLRSGARIGSLMNKFRNRRT